MTARRFAASALLGLVLVAVCGVPWAAANHTNFQDTCAGGAYNITSKMKRSQSRGYAAVARYEGYQWGGGCWNNNNTDDAPGDPTGDPNSNGEGGDCSGFTAKAWYLRPDTSQSGFRIHDAMENYHGPLQAWEYRDGVSAPVFNIAKADAIMMDAFASGGHVATIYATYSYNADDMIEARGEAYGTGIWRQTYRGNPDYAGVRRAMWQLECHPNCAGAESEPEA